MKLNLLGIGTRRVLSLVLVAVSLLLEALAFLPANTTALTGALLVMGDIQLDDTNTVCTKLIMPGVVDNFFKSGPLIALLKSRFSRKWIGPQIQENFLYKPMKGGAYRKGGTFDTTKRQTRTGLLFTPRYYAINITEFLEDLEVEMAGPTAAFSVIKTDLSTAAMSLSAILEIAAYRHGQNVGGNDRTAEMNGLEEALTNGTDQTFSGATFPLYGGQARVDVSPALNSPTGLISASINGGTANFRVLEHSYMSCVIGNERPSKGLTTNRGMGYIAENFTPQQKIDVVDPEINWPGMKFNQATIMYSQYTPGADGVNDADLGNYNNSTETFWWLNPGPQGDDAYLRLFIAQSSKFAFGFTGFKGARGDNQVSGQILFGGNLVVRAARLMRSLYGIQR